MVPNFGAIEREGGDAVFYGKFKAEVRGFMLRQERQDAVIGHLQGVIDDLRKQNAQLLDRLMARDFRELKQNDTDVLARALERIREPGLPSLLSEDYAGEVLDGVEQ